jgi:hypothetical protein
MVEKKIFVLVKLIKYLKIYLEFKLIFPKKVQMSYLGGKMGVKRVRSYFDWPFPQSIDM